MLYIFERPPVQRNLFKKYIVFEQGFPALKDSICRVSELTGGEFARLHNREPLKVARRRTWFLNLTKIFALGQGENFVNLLYGYRNLREADNFTPLPVTLFEYELYGVWLFAIAAGGVHHCLRHCFVELVANVYGNFFDAERI